MLEPKNTKVILCSPEGEANMGGAARTMSCFGVEELILVAPRHQPERTAKNWACHGLPVLEAAVQVPTLDEAVKDVNLIAGFTRRCGRSRHKLLSLPEFYRELASHPQPGKVALVFGNEESGLSNQEIEGCHRLVTIPSQGSLNLSHAVSLALYELFGRQQPVPGTRPKKLASPEQRKILIDVLSRYLGDMGYPPQRGTSLTKEMARFADIIDRAHLEEWEINYLGGMFKHLHVKYHEFKQKAEEATNKTEV
ncbi:RNA methyltransferase [bacterium]|nr:RNA methyltransferase [bacterium]